MPDTPFPHSPLFARLRLLFFIMIFRDTPMIRTPLGLLCLALLALLFTHAQTTLVTFYVDHEVEQPLDYVEINAIVKANGESLEAVIKEAADTIGSIEQLVDAYCKGYTAKDKQKEECSELVDASPYSIKPQY